MPSILQDVLICLLAAWMAVDNGSGGQILNYWPVTIGFVAGLIMGNMNAALVIAGTFQLMSLGVAALGGASVPEYGLATIIGVFLAARTGASTGTAIAVSLPVGLLAIQLDVLIKIINNYFAHLSLRLLHEKKFNMMRLSYLCSVLMWTMKYFIPTLVVVLFGTQAVQIILHVIPKWFTTGLQVAGGMLPVVGIAMLMHYMPTKKYFAFLIFGFVFSAYLKMPILGVALLGAGAALIIFQNNLKESQRAATNTQEDVQGDDYDE